MVSGAFWFAVFIVSHALVFHWRPRPERVGALAFTFLLALTGHAATAVLVTRDAQWLGHAVHGGAPTVAAVGALEMAALAALYLPFYYTVNTSLSVQMMIRLARAPQHTLPEVDVRAILMADELLRGRLEGLAASGFMRRDDGRYVLTPKGRRLARFFQTVRGCWRLGTGG
jgi:hypothetical protein